MWKLAPLALLSACSVADQEPVRTISVVEVVLNNAQDREDLLNILREFAKTDSELHVDDMSDKWRDFEAHSSQMSPLLRVSFYVGVWRGRDDDEEEVGASDMGHLQRVWLDFPVGRNPTRSAALRARLLKLVHSRWPDARPIPVLPSGAIPLAPDLIETPSGYKVKQSAAARYGLALSSSLVAHE